MELNGIHSMAYEDYAKAEGVNKSSLDYIAPPYTPAHFRARFITGELKDEETPAKRLGSLTHRCVLEPETLEGAFHIKPGGMKFTTKDGIAWRDEHEDRPIITTPEARQIEAMRDAVWRHPLAKRLLAGGQMERSVFATDENGILRKARLDCLPPAGNILPDLKTVESTDEHWFEKQNENCRWFVQAAYSISITKLLGMAFENFAAITVEKTPPYDVVVRDFSDLLHAGRMCFERDLMMLRQCREKNEWPGRSNHFEPATLPAWAMKGLEQI